MTDVELDEIDLDNFDPFAPEHRVNPYPRYNSLRTLDPVHLDPEGFWILTRHADCEAVLRDSRWSSNSSHARDQRPIEEQSMREVMAAGFDFPVLLFMDPPDHTRLRKLVSKAFTPRSVERLRPRIQSLVDGFLDEAEARGGMELIQDLAYPLPVTVICEMLGVPSADQHLFGPWSSDASRLLDDEIDDDTAQRGLLAVMQLLNYFNDLFDERRADPQDDLLTALLAAEEEGDKLSDTELRATTLLLFIAGHETTMNLIGNGMLALLRNRAQYELLHADPTLASSAVEELLRYDGPVHLTGRVALEDLHVAGRRFEAGEQVVTLVAAANRDPARFDRPDELDIRRADNHHLTFSQGIHYCLGAALARVEGQVALGTIARRFPDLELVTTDPQYRDHFVLRGLRELDLRL
jgi:cytochrome P450